MTRKRELLGDILRNISSIGDKEIEECLNIQREKGGRIGAILVRAKHIREIDLLKALSIQLHIPYVQNLTEEEIDKELVSSVPISFLKRHVLIPFHKEDGVVKVAISDPLNITPIDDIRTFLESDIELCLTESITILNAINMAYETHKEAAEQVIEDLGDAALTVGLDEPIDLIDVVDEAPIIKLIHSLLFRSVKDRASDIHFEPFERDIAVRFRIDGVLHNIHNLPKRFQPSVTSRIKIMASLNIAEKRLPQDGRIGLKIAGKDIDVRVSIIPTSLGERIVMRLLDKSGYLLRLKDIGLSKDLQSRFNKLIHLTHGITLVTGPTGSGKTTTLYAMLSEMKSPSKNILTIEDPVEYKFEGVNQVQIKPEIGLTFATALRSFLRQDPDIMLVGEVRDLETAQICIRSALTGHLVLSTLHTNDAPTAINRIMDIGIESYMLAPSLLLVVAQRLVRKLCLDCKEAYELNPEEASNIKLKAELIYKHRGCAKCNNTGHKGRICIAEVLLITPKIQELINQKASFQKIREVARQEGMQTLYDSAIKKVEEGIISLEEALSTTLGAD